MVRQPYEPQQPASARSSMPSTPPQAPREEEPAPAEAPSARSVGQRAADGVKQHGIATAAVGGGTLISGISLLADILEKAGKISSAIGMQLTALFIGAMVLMAVYLARRERAEADTRAWQEQRDADARADRERTRLAYENLIAREMQRERDAHYDAHVSLQGEVHKLGGKVEEVKQEVAGLTARFDEAARVGSTLRFARVEDPRG